MSITVLNPGLLTTVQDLGRMGYQQFGVSVSGVMDPRAAAIGNILVGNPQGEAVLECTLMAGQTLRFGAPKAGCRAYIAFAGGLDIPLVMGSRSTYMKAAIGGFEGRKLQKGDVLGLRAPVAGYANLHQRAIAPEFVPRPVYTLRVVLGPQDDAFTPEGVATFLGSEYTVTNEFDRMGCRMDGPAIQHKNGGDIISDGIAFGAIQVPGSGKPILMGADRQTTGGYTKIATVISADFRLLAQLKAGDKVRFEAVSVQAAQQALHFQRGALALLADVVKG